MPDLTAEQSSVLSGLGGIITTVDGLLKAGVSAAEVAEKVLAFVDPSLAGSVESLIKVLQELETLLSKV